ncbi:hypothetical protein [Burkholderia pseudomallei]|uniref:hypothetical protein n=2 Tax=Burkholderia pseudomallei TaxID=28450 RepID=UPI000537F5BF|nr:hypothetical protein [Burkholderia pseudomallei]KGU98987.1 hypothetical protein X885_3363 [Burkholderia pseudomallei MSHR4372]
MSIASPVRPPRRRVARALVLAAFVALAALGGTARASPGDAPAARAARAARGARLFDGSDPMHGRLAGHAQVLPSTASRCANCHQPPAPRAAPALAPPLDASSLLAPQKRRGGPPSAYTADSFCATLRSGIDPAHVTLKAAMPRYDATDAQCADLWAFLIPIPTSR